MHRHWKSLNFSSFQKTFSKADCGIHHQTDGILSIFESMAFFSFLDYSPSCSLTSWPLVFSEFLYRIVLYFLNSKMRKRKFLSSIQQFVFSQQVLVWKCILYGNAFWLFFVHECFFQEPFLQVGFTCASWLFFFHECFSGEYKCCEQCKTCSSLE